MDSPTISDSIKPGNFPRMSRAYIENQYSLQHTLYELRDVGLLTVKVHRATGLAAADFGGTSDPVCMLELGNTRFQTKTKTHILSPKWEETFSFEIRDINSALEVTVYDEDYEKVDFLGKVLIPLLRIHNNEQRWYCLKDKYLLKRAKGGAMILLEMNIIWNPIRACIRSLGPKENYLQDETKFRVPEFVKNVLRLKALIMPAIKLGKVIHGYCDWETPTYNAIALAIYITVCYSFKPYMIPAFLLTIFFKEQICHLFNKVLLQYKKHTLTNTEILEENEDEDKGKEEKKSLKRRFHDIQDATQSIQHTLGELATFGEQVKNTFNFTVPFLSYLAMGLTFMGMVLLYFMPLRYAMMLIGVYKFIKKLIRPDLHHNNEIRNLLSRVPDNEELLRYHEFQPKLPIKEDGMTEEQCSKKSDAEQP